MPDQDEQVLTRSPRIETRRPRKREVRVFGDPLDPYEAGQTYEMLYWAKVAEWSDDWLDQLYRSLQAAQARELRIRPRRDSAGVCGALEFADNIDEFESRGTFVEFPGSSLEAEFTMKDGVRVLVFKSHVGAADELRTQLQAWLETPQRRFEVCEVSAPRSFGQPRQPKREIVDRFDGIIRDISGSDITVSLIDEDAEFMTTLPRSLFEDHGVDVRKGEGFRFWGEREKDRPYKEQLVVQPLKKKRLTAADQQRIRQDIQRLTDGAD